MTAYGDDLIGPHELLAQARMALALLEQELGQAKAREDLLLERIRVLGESNNNWCRLYFRAVDSRVDEAIRDFQGIIDGLDGQGAAAA